MTMSKIVWAMEVVVMKLLFAKGFVQSTSMHILNYLL